MSLDELVSTNPVLTALSERKSVRRYTPEPVTEDDVAAIIEAAVQAPTAGNQQLYTILRITDQGVKERLAELCDDQHFIAEAPLVLVFCADQQKWFDGYELSGAHPRDPGAGDLMLAVLDTAIAAQNAVTAAHSLGLGSCYIGDVLERIEDVKTLLALPDLVVPAVAVVFGHPTEQQLHRSKPHRSPTHLIVQENGYHRLGETELRELWAGRLGHHTWEEWVRMFCARKFDSDFSVEMTRSVAEYLRLFAAYGSAH